MNSEGSSSSSSNLSSGQPSSRTPPQTPVRAQPPWQPSPGENGILQEPLNQMYQHRLYQSPYQMPTFSAPRQSLLPQPPYEYTGFARGNDPSAFAPGQVRSIRFPTSSSL
uniref:AT rich interactive domain 1B (SWI1-like) n=1 Tax=Mesocestoides corti TaxID=53468 RepID=A0A5K3F4V3_MESCO